MIPPADTICGRCGYTCADSVPRPFRVPGECVCPDPPLTWPGVPVHDMFPRAAGSPVGASRKGSEGKGLPGRFRRVLGLLAGLAGAVPGTSSPALGASWGHCVLWARAEAASDAATMSRPTAEALAAMYRDAFANCYTADGEPPLPALEPDAAFLARLLASLGPGPSGEPTGSPAWRRWCAMNFPRSFREADGTVILEASGKGRRTPCPG